jgi:SAM-dependent methyltransferase
LESKAAYDILAEEYYEPRHKTSRNFDSATKEALESIDLRIPSGLVLDVGSGRGRCGEYLGIEPARVVQLDNSIAMLSLKPREDAFIRILHDAEELPFPDGEFACVAAFLCDPFLGLNFLAEARRVLSDGGILIGTTPSEQWGRPLRDALGLDPMVTRFVLAGGQEMTAPSAIYSNKQLHEMLRVVGFRESKIDINTHTLPDGTDPVSEDILTPAKTSGLSPYSLGILSSFIAAV